MSIRINISHDPTTVSLFHNDVLLTNYTGNIYGYLPKLVNLAYSLGSEDGPIPPIIHPPHPPKPSGAHQPEIEKMIDEGSPVN